MRRHVVALVVVEQAPIFELAIPCEVFGIQRDDLADPAEADTVIVGAAPQPVRFSPDDPLLDALREAHRRGARIAAICSGAYALAAAGLLDGRPATTHWLYAADFAAQFPAVKVDPDVLYIDDGDILTS